MAASFDLVGNKLQIKRKVGTLDSGKDKVATITLDGVDENAAAQLLVDVSAAVGSVISTPVIENYRVSTDLINPGE